MGNHLEKAIGIEMFDKHWMFLGILAAWVRLSVIGLGKGCWVFEKQQVGPKLTLDNLL